MIFRDVKKNKIKTLLIFGLFMGMVYLLIYFVGMMFDLSTPIFILVAFIFSFTSAIGAYYNSDKIILSLNKARPATHEEDLMLTNLLEGLCLGAGMPKPKLYIMEDSAMNAFATGRNPEHAVICVTTGLIERLDKYELEAVLAHELSHIKNYDILLQTVAIVMVGFVVIISDLVSRNIYLADNDSDNKGSGIIMIIGLIFVILSPIFAELLKLAISRNREYLADANAVEITRNKGAMINALRKISDDPELLEQAHKSSESLFIVSPLKNKKNKDNLFSTHPSIENRIARISTIN